MKKRFLSLTICAALILSLMLSGCGSSSSNTAPNEDAKPTQNTVVDNRTTVAVSDKDFEFTENNTLCTGEYMRWIF